MNDIMGSLRYGNPHQQQQYEKEQQEKLMQYQREQQERAMQDDRYRNQPIPPAPTAPSPIRTAVELLDERISKLQAVTERLFINLKPITSSSDDCYPAETPSTRVGNSSLNIDINAMADRIGAVAHALQLQIDRLEV